MSTQHNGFPSYWTNERDWLVELVPLPDTEPEEEIAEVLAWVGRLFAFAMVTDTRMLAQMGDPLMPAYELWFSFDTEENKQRFLQMVREDGYANPDEEGSFEPPRSLDDLPNLRPIRHVFPKKESDMITAVAVITHEKLEVSPNMTN